MKWRASCVTTKKIVSDLSGGLAGCWHNNTKKKSQVHVTVGLDASKAGSRITFRSTFWRFFQQRDCNNEISSSALLGIQLTLLCVCGVDSFIPWLDGLPWPGPNVIQRQQSYTSVWNQRNHSRMSPIGAPRLFLDTNIFWIFGFLDFFFKGLGVPHPQGWGSLTPAYFWLHPSPDREDINLLA